MEVDEEKKKKKSSGVLYIQRGTYTFWLLIRFY